jgi:hypothetical protein
MRLLDDPAKAMLPAQAANVMAHKVFPAGNRTYVIPFVCSGPNRDVRRLHFTILYLLIWILTLNSDFAPRHPGKTEWRMNKCDYTRIFVSTFYILIGPFHRLTTRPSTSLV